MGSQPITDAELEARATELFERWRVGDLEFVEKSFAPDAVVRIPALDIEGTFGQLRPRLAAQSAQVGPHTHEAAVTIARSPDLVVRRHVTHWSDRDGQPRFADVCCVLRFDGEARIAEMEEYVRFDGLDDPRVRALTTVQAHVDSEFTNDVEQIMPTISTRDVYFPIVTKGPGDWYKVDLIVDTASAREYYRMTRDLYEVLSSVHVNGLASDWYTVRASVGRLALRAGTPFGHPGLEVDNPSVVIFPVADDGIIGEVLWTKYDFGDVVNAAAAGKPMPVHDSDPDRSRRHAETLRAWLAARTRGDVAALEILLSDPCCLVSKVVDPTDYRTLELHTLTERSALIGHLRDEPVPQNLQVVTQLVTDWYAVVEARHGHGIDGPIRRRVMIVPFAADGRIVGELAYSIQLPR